MLTQLDAAITQYVRGLANRKGFREIRCEHSAMGALRDFVCENLVIRLVNDRRLIDIEIAPAASPTEFRAVSLFMDLLTPAPHGRWNLGVGGGTKFLEQHWGRINQLLAADAYRVTLESVDAAGRRFMS